MTRFSDLKTCGNTVLSPQSLIFQCVCQVFPGSDPTEAQIHVTEEAEGYLEKIREKLEAEGIRTETTVRYGFPAEEILAHINRGGVDLLAMTTHGRTGPARMVMGSVAEQVVRHSDIPVLLFRVAGSKVHEKKRAAPAA